MSGTIIYVQRNGVVKCAMHYSPSDEAGEAFEQFKEMFPEYQVISEDFEIDFVCELRDEAGQEYQVEFCYVDEFTTILTV